MAKCASNELLERLEQKFEPEPNTGCWLWTGCALKSGYGRIGVGGSVKLAHRVSWEIHRGAIPDGLFVLHKCDTPACVNPDHLFVGTHLDNGRDKARKGRSWHPVGALHGRSKFTESDVVEIRSMCRDGISLAEIASRYGVSDSTISAIKTRRNWNHVA